MKGIVVEEVQLPDAVDWSSTWYSIEGEKVVAFVHTKRLRDGRAIAIGHGAQVWSPGDDGYEDHLAIAKAAIAAKMSKQ